ncbi:MAG: DNA primase [Deltaproteobacteria bacterium]|nr:DNA primase [Deltaproteobacteria bacterium]
MIKQEQIAQIRNRASIVEVISDYVTLKKTGRNHMGLCPFHGEKTPSFTVNEEKGIFHCFGCQAGGSVFNFLMQYDHLSFPEAVERVAKRYGIEIERDQRGGQYGDQGARELLYRLNERAAVNYQRMLTAHPEGKRAREYLKQRGLDEATVKNFMIGFAPPYGSGLIEVIKQEKFSVQDALKLGLIGQKAPQQYHEKFFARVMFPILNPGGKVVAFGGRVLDQALPKYLNSSETPLFHKSGTLYGLFHAKDGIRKSDRVVVVEGYLDVIALFQHGIDYAVATLGTALTVDHVRLLSRYTKNIIALFDGDVAGQKAASRSFEVFVEAGLLGRAAFLPPSEDPDTFVRKQGKAALEAILEKAVPLPDYFFEWLDKRFGRTLEGKKQTAEEVNRVLTKVRTQVEVDLLVRRAADLGIDERVLRRPVASQPQVRNAAGIAPVPVLRDDFAERSLVALMLVYPQRIVPEVETNGEVRQALSAKWAQVVDVIIAEWQEHSKVDVVRVGQRLAAERAAELTGLALEGERVEEAESGRMASDCLIHLRRQHLRSLERTLRMAIRAAEERKDENAKRERILEWQDIVRKERQLERRRLDPKNMTS